MITLVNFITIVCGGLITYKTSKRILNGGINLFGILVIIFFIFQHIPIIVGSFVEIRLSDWFFAPNIGKALLDEKVAFVYDIYITVVIYILYKLSKKEDDYLKFYIDRLHTIRFNSLINIILMLCMFSPIVGVLYAPEPSIYLKWAYFYRYSPLIIEELYHEEVMKDLLLLSLGSSLIFYSQKSNRSIITYIVIALVTWLSFKRTLLVFGSALVLFFDLIQNRYSNRSRQLLKKTILVLVICVGYFVYYAINSEKVSAASSVYVTYTMYFSREYSVKVAILDLLNESKMLAYSGQSILFDLFFYVPRSFWPEKPIMYTKYLTTYCQGFTLDNISSTNFYGNIWAESLSNFNFFGIFYAFFVLFVIKRISEKSNNIAIYFLGNIFLIFYFFWCVQGFTIFIISFWTILLLLKRIKIIK